MKILNITRTKYLCELTYEEIKAITLNKLYNDDLKRLCTKEEDIPVSDFIQKVNIHEEYQIKQAIKSLDSASNFLSKKFEQLQGIKELKESK